MIQINELRIGNLIRVNGILSKIEIINNELDEVYFLGEDFYHSDFCCNIEPIQLTEEWLLKFWFKKRKNRHLFHWENKIVISEYKDEFENFFYPKTGYDIRFSNEIKYVHQLQNLYFALTGAELTVA